MNLSVEFTELFGMKMDGKAVALIKTQAARISCLQEVLEGLCAHAEPVCDCLEVGGQVLQHGNTLRLFRGALDAGRDECPSVALVGLRNRSKRTEGVCGHEA